MPFAALPSSPGFAQPNAPDWTRFAAQANEFIQRGGEMRAQAGKDLSDSIEKAASQIDSIIQNNSPEAKMAKALKREALKAQMGLYQEYKSMTPEQRQATFEFKGGMLTYRDKNKQIMEAVRFKNALKQGALLDKRLSAGSGTQMDDYMRHHSARAPVNTDSLTSRLSSPVVNLGGDTGGGTPTADDYSAELMDTGGVAEAGELEDATDDLDALD